MILLLLQLLNFETKAYPQYIGMGYQSCLNCHYNPMGNGPLTDYGRVVGATAIARKDFAPSLSNSDLEEVSKFLYGTFNHKTIKPSADFRWLAYRPTLESESEVDVESFVMEGDANVVVTNKDQSLYASVTFGYAPPRGRSETSDDKTYRTREHYVAYRPWKNHGFYLGLMDKAYGIRVPDHILYSRIATGNTMNDQTHGLLYHYLNEKYELGAHAFVGNLANDEEVRRKGGSLKFEYSPFSITKMGFSYLNSESQLTTQNQYAFHLKQGLDKGSAIMLEFGRVTDGSLSDSKEVTSQYLMAQTYLMATRGVFFILGGESYKADIESETSISRYSLGLQYFPIHSVEMRLDLYNTKIYKPEIVGKDRFDLSFQVHMWL